MKYSIILGLLMASFSISAQVTSIDTLANDTTKVIKKKVLNKTTTAQTTTTTQTDFTPNVIPPSPNAASLGKYGDIPVSYYTGLVNTSIPIYTISDQDIQIPISLSYHHGGIRVEEEASVIGLGWSLNAGGVITRTIRGRDDLHPVFGAAFNPPVSEYLPDPLSNTTFTTKTNSYANPQLDTEPDLFYYNIGGKSGKFILDAQLRSTWPSEGIKGLLIDKSDIKIRCLSRTGTGRTSYKYSWEIIDENGIKYTFAEQEINGNMYASNISPISTESNPSFDAAFDYNSEKSHNITAWYITSIFSPQTTTTVTFDYYRTGKYFSVSRASVSETYATSGTITSSNPSDPNCTTAQPLSVGDLTPSTSVNVNISRNSYLKAINFSTGKVEFQMNDRDDIQKWQQTTDATLPFTGYGTEAMVNDGLIVENNVEQNPLKLSNIDIKDLGGSLVKRFALEQSYFNALKVGTIPTSPTRAFNMTRYNNLRLRLDAVKEYDKTLLSHLPPYKFSYEGDILDASGNVTSPVELPSKTSWAKDYWGYNNGKTANNSATRIIPKLFYPKMAAFKISPNNYGFEIVGIGNTNEIGIDRLPQESFKKYGTLKSIVYPTGGNTTFTYESNKAIGKLNGMYTNYYETNSASNSPSFALFSEDLFAEITFRLDCSRLANASGSIMGCDPIQQPDDNIWYAKITKNGQDYAVKNYSDWTGFTCDNPVNSEQKCYKVTTTTVRLTNNGTYQLMVNPQASSFPKPQISIRTFKLPEQNQPEEIETSGLRIKRIINHDNLNVSSTKEFDYVDENGLTTGIQMRDPLPYLYGYSEMLEILETAGQTISYPCQSLWWGIKLQSSSLAPLGTSAGGNHVGYSRVTVKELDLNNQDNGKSVFEYVNLPDTPPSSRVFPDIATAWNGSNGMLLKESNYNKNNFVVKETLNDFPVKNISFSNVYNGFRFFIGNQLLADQNQTHSVRVTKSVYNIHSDFWYSPKSRQRVYDLNDPSNTKFVETETETVFGSIEHLQPTAQKSFDSKNRLLETTMLYPHEMVSLNRDPQGTYADMVTSNIISPVIEQVQKVNGLQIGLTQKNYLKFYNTFFAPENVKTQKGATEELVTKITFNNYTSDGKPILYTELNGITTSLEYWDATDINKKNLVKTKIVGTGPMAQTTTYDYFPLIGIKETVQPNGIKMTYKYDDFNRLENIRDTNGKLIKSNTYNYKTGQ